MKNTQSTIAPRAFGSQFQPRRRILARLAGVLVLGASAFMAAGVGSASAAPGDAWEQGCAYRAPSGIPGQGQSGLNDYCARLRFCQSMSDQGRDLAPMGCVGFEPSRRPAGKRS